MSQRVAIGSDHAGFEYKTYLIKKLKKLGLQVMDMGTDGDQSVDYPDFAHPVATKVANKEVNFGAKARIPPISEMALVSYLL